MNKRETVRAFVDAIQQGEFENTKSLLGGRHFSPVSVPEKAI
jgi:hypothetical protein